MRSDGGASERSLAQAARSANQPASVDPLPLARETMLRERVICLCVRTREPMYKQSPLTMAAFLATVHTLHSLKREGSRTDVHTCRLQTFHSLLLSGRPLYSSSI